VILLDMQVEGRGAGIIATTAATKYPLSRHNQRRHLLIMVGLSLFLRIINAVLIFFLSLKDIVLGTPPLRSQIRLL